MEKFYDVPAMSFEFKYDVHSKNGTSYECSRRVIGHGIDHAVAKFSEEFLEWGEPVPTWRLMGIWSIES